ncbi:hypothetical protein JOM56_012777 [Amanita muscaria]
MDSDVPEKDYNRILGVLQEENVSILELVNVLLTEKRFKNHAVLIDLLRNAGTVVTSILGHRQLSDEVRDQICAVIERIYAQEIEDLVQVSAGWHFSAQQAALRDIEDFAWESIAHGFTSLAPRLWSLLDALLLAQKRKSSLILDRNAMVVDGPDDDELLENGLDQDEAILEGNGSSPLQSTSSASRKEKLLNIRKAVIISIMMHSTNRKANRFQSILGIFLHSVGTPQKVISALSRMGVCIGQTTIYDAVNSLSDNAADGIRELGQTLLAAYAYDNFDVDLKQSVPVIEKSNQTLKHLTSGLLFPLQHGKTKEDLACSDYLWQRSKLNPRNSQTVTGMKTYCDLPLLFYGPGNAPPSHASFNTWIFLRDLIEQVEGFDYLQGQFEIPELLEAIPVKKTDIIPAYAMDVNNSTVNGNIQAIEQLMAQGGVGSPDDADTVDISKYVALVHGDLGTGKRIKSLMNRHAIEDRAWESFQYVKFCPAKQTGTIKSKCEFRRMHQVIQHVGAVRQLDCWCVAVQELRPSFTSLEEFAKSKPKLDELKTMAEKLVSEFVANHRISTVRLNPEAQRDQQFENVALMQQYFLLYEELTFAMNHSDITRFEKVLLPWIQLFKATVLTPRIHSWTENKDIIADLS